MEMAEIGTERRYQEAVQHHWGWYLALGIALIILGIIAIGVPQWVTLATAMFIGWVLIIGGIAYAVHSLWVREWGNFFLTALAGVVYLFTGILLISHPVAGVVALTLLLGLLFLIQGAFRISVAFALRPLANWGLVLVSGISSFIIALLILFGWPASAFWAIGLLVGIDLLFAGISLTALAIPARREAHAHA
jgi:uncharacterized membrane protein HdeD (DUF308 family)